MLENKCFGVKKTIFQFFFHIIRVKQNKTRALNKTTQTIKKQNLYKNNGRTFFLSLYKTLAIAIKRHIFVQKSFFIILKKKTEYYINMFF